MQIKKKKIEVQSSSPPKNQIRKAQMTKDPQRASGNQPICIKHLTEILSDQHYEILALLTFPCAANPGLG